MKKRLVVFVVLVLLLLSPMPALADGDYVINGSFDSGLDDWETTGTVSTDNTAPAYDGDYAVLGPGATISQAIEINPLACPVSRVSLAGGVTTETALLVIAGWDDCPTSTSTHSGALDAWRNFETLRSECGQATTPYTLTIANADPVDDLHIDSISMTCVRVGGSMGITEGQLESGESFYVQRLVTWGDLATGGIGIGLFAMLWFVFVWIANRQYEERI